MAKPEEQHAIQVLVQTVANETFGHLFGGTTVPIGEEKEWSLSWIAAANDRIIGIVLTHDDSITDLWVIGEQRGAGIGGKLLTQAEVEIVTRGYHTARLRVVKANVTAVRFYQKSGYRIAREFPHEKYPWPMLEMTKMINRPTA